jgi:hypothetical protein
MIAHMRAIMDEHLFFLNSSPNNGIELWVFDNIVNGNDNVVCVCVCVLLGLNSGSCTCFSFFQIASHDFAQAGLSCNSPTEGLLHSLDFRHIVERGSC